jgi:precorrin-6B methylase 2
MANKENLGENNKDYNYSVLDVYRIKSSNMIWYVIDFLSCKFNRFAKKYQNSLENEYKKESEIFNLENSKKILHIGCGAFPISAMILYKLNGGKIIGIDSNTKFVRFAQRVINKRKLSDRIEIKHGDVETFPLDDFDTIIISGCSVPRIKVLHHIFKTAKPNTKIIVRELYSQNQPVEKLISHFKNIDVIKKIDNHPYPTAGWESFCLQKRK